MTTALNTRITRPDLNSQWLGSEAILRSLDESKGAIILMSTAPETAVENSASIDLYGNRPMHWLPETVVENFASLDLMSSISRINYNFPQFYLYRATENATRLDRAILEMKASKEITEPDDFLDWDLYLDKEPPAKTIGTIKLRFKYVGRSKPIKIDDPWV
jgi:hypothetical protein